MDVRRKSYLIFISTTLFRELLTSVCSRDSYIWIDLISVTEIPTKAGFTKRIWGKLGSLSGSSCLLWKRVVNANFLVPSLFMCGQTKQSDELFLWRSILKWPCLPNKGFSSLFSKMGTKEMDSWVKHLVWYSLPFVIDTDSFSSWSTVQMRLYTLTKRQFVLVFVAFFVSFFLTAIIGIAG